MPNGDPDPLPATINHNHSSAWYGGYVCNYCGMCVNSNYGYSHYCYGWPAYQPVWYQPVYQVPTVTIVPTPDPNQQAILEELKLMRKALETLVDRTVNDHEEVRRCDDGGSGDPTADLARGFEDCTLRDVTEVTKRLGL